MNNIQHTQHLLENIQRNKLKEDCKAVEQGIENMVKSIFRDSVIGPEMYNEFGPHLHIDDKSVHLSYGTHIPIVFKIIEMGELGYRREPGSVIRTAWLHEEPKISISFREEKKVKVHVLKIHFHDYCRWVPGNLSRITCQIEQLNRYSKKDGNGLKTAVRTDKR